MPRFDPPGQEPDDDKGEWLGFDNYGLKSEQFIVTDNPVVATLLGPDGEVVAVTRERDDRFGFAKWAEDR